MGGRVPPAHFFRAQEALSHSGPERVVVRSIEAGVTVYSPHTALDAVPGGVNDWLAESLGPGVARAIELKGESGDPLCGSGRLVTLEREVSFEDLVARVKKSLGLERIRVAKSPSGTVVRTVALCPGAGGSVICSEAADLYLTGEMRHHDVLAANARGTSVILGEHSNTERGYLGRFRELLLSRLGLDDDRVIVSQVDSDPISIA
ncbi:MAG: Nif3-like dinuclear metal center hexameric protein [Planctomycetota bacterium]